MEKRLKFILYNWDTIIRVLFPLIKLSVKVDFISKKKIGKKNLVSTFSSSNNKVIFVLLIKVVVFYIGFIVIYA